MKAHDFWSWQLALSPDGSRVASVTGQYLAGGWKYEPAEAAAAGSPEPEAAAEAAAELTAEPASEPAEKDDSDATDDSSTLEDN